MLTPLESLRGVRLYPSGQYGRRPGTCPKGSPLAWRAAALILVSSTVPTIAVLMDLAPEHRYHTATLSALRHASDSLGAGIDVRVVTTDTIDRRLVADPVAAVVVGPGSPYRNPESVHDVVRSAREKGIPVVGT